MKIRGWIGEKKTTFKMWLSLNARTYRRFHNLVVPSKNGTTQIDHLIVSPYGLFIVETKNRKGWIFGSEDQPTWTQVLYNEKHTFQNPLRQVYRQKMVLAEFLGVQASIIHTIVYFVGDCTFKTPLPHYVRKSRLGKYIRTFRRRVLPPQDVDRVIAALNQHLAQSSLTNKDHLRSLRQRHASDTVCPRCGSPLVMRTARKGRDIGAKFFGCTGYPKCRYTKDIAPR